jgi:hypothetical protein
VDGRRFESNVLGEASFWIGRGPHTIVIEKPGYTKVSLELEVSGRIFFYLKDFLASLMR